ncbi:MAG: EamA family transporter [Alphaproteobacteria bacterium]|jgi:drug/metabolite transporter (DMT)-like permease|nr:EamA family transporter [Alphaproteobacteria bacterium]
MTPPVEPGDRRAAGWLWVLVAIAIWASWFAVTAHGVRGTLATADLVLIRVVVPTLLLAGALWAARRRLATLGVGDLLGLALYGLPFIAFVAAGLAHAPVSHAVALVPGVMPVLAGLWAAFGEGVRHPPRRRLGFALMIAGAGSILALGPTGSALGHGFFLAASACLAVFTVTARRLALPPFVATGIVAGLSSLVLVPAYLALPLGRIAAAPWSEIALQILMQGLLAGLLAIYAYARAIRSLGVATAAAAVALVPPTATLIGWAALGERPSVGEAIAVTVVAAGVLAAADVRLKAPGRAGTTRRDNGRSAV